MRLPRILIAALPAAALGAFVAAGPAVAAPTARGARVHLVRVARLHAPTSLTAPRGDRHRVFVTEKGGRVRVIVNGRARSRPFLDLRDRVKSEGEEQGLLSLAFAPDYARSHRFFVAYTARDDSVRVVAFRRSARSANVADRASARDVITIPHPDFTNHNGGQLAFGPDGDLYVGVGDGGDEGDPNGNAQSLSTLLGKVLRIAPGADGGYAIPDGNPFAGRDDARAEIWALGFRNPWRFSFDPRTGSLVVADVGQDSEEEIDFAPRGTGAGANYGWNVREGDAGYASGDDAGDVAPALVLRHDHGYCAVVGGYVVRDRALKGLYGRYLYGDFCKPGLRSVRLGAKGASGDRATGLAVPQLSSFGEDGRGRVYAVSLDGRVYRLARG